MNSHHGQKMGLIQSPDDLDRIDTLIQLALDEDLGSLGDITTQAVIHESKRGQARILAKTPLILAGLPVAERVCQRVDSSLVFEKAAYDGVFLSSGQIVARIRGPLASILVAERTLLNFLQRLSGIATLTRQFVDAIAGTGVEILDTRKTTPGWRVLEKYAVRIGGGRNHRFGLYDMILIKDNHIDAVGGITQALTACLERVKTLKGTFEIAVEVRNLAQLEQALAFPIHWVLLDHFDLSALRSAVKMAKGRVRLEASGNVTLKTVRAIAETGVDAISIGALTHSAPAVDLSLQIDLFPS